MPPIVAYIAEGKLFLKRGDLQPERIERPVVQSIADRAARDQERNAWQAKGAIDGMPQGML